MKEVVRMIFEFVSDLLAALLSLIGL